MSDEIKVVKSGTCPSLSGRSELKYEVGVQGDKDIQIRLVENSGSGMFSAAWIPLAQIDALLSATDKTITSGTIRPLYSGSVNSTGFLVSLLKHIGLIKSIDENSRGHVRCDPQKFTTEILAPAKPKKKGEQ